MKRKIVGFSEAGYPIYDDELYEQYMKLVQAIVEQARTDYVKIYQKLITTRSESRTQDLLVEKKRLERFFFSDWFEALVGAKCPKSYVRDLQQEALDKLKETYRRRMDSG